MPTFTIEIPEHIIEESMKRFDADQQAVIGAIKMLLDLKISWMFCNWDDVMKNKFYQDVPHKPNKD